MSGSKKHQVRDIVEPVREINGLLKDNIATWFDLTNILWEENLKILSIQLDSWLAVQENYIGLVRDISEKFTNGLISWNGSLNPIETRAEKLISFQKDYADMTKTSSEKLTKDLIALNQKNIENVLKAFDNYLDTLV